MSWLAFFGIAPLMPIVRDELGLSKHGFLFRPDDHGDVTSTKPWSQCAVFRSQSGLG